LRISASVFPRYNTPIGKTIQAFPFDFKEAEDFQDIEAHLLGDIPNRDIDNLGNYWEVYNALKKKLFKPSKRANYSKLSVAKEDIKKTIFNHPEFTQFNQQLDVVFSHWNIETTAYLKALNKGLKPKREIYTISENLLKAYGNLNLIDKYDVYQCLMNYWIETMQDDMYELAADGWKAGNEVKRLEKKIKKGEKEVFKLVGGIEGLEGRLIPPNLIIKEFFFDEQKAIDDLKAKLVMFNEKMEILREEHGEEDGLLSNAIDEKQKISKKILQKVIKSLGTRNIDNALEYDMLEAYKKLLDDEAITKNKIKTALSELEMLIIDKYPKLSIEEIKIIVVDNKWSWSIMRQIKTELDNISYRLNERIKELAVRYEIPLPRLTNYVNELSQKVKNHLKHMNFVW